MAVGLGVAAGRAVAAGLGVAMGNASAAAKAAAGQIGPDAAPCGVAQLCRQLWPEAF